MTTQVPAPGHSSTTTTIDITMRAQDSDAISAYKVALSHGFSAKLEGAGSGRSTLTIQIYDDRDLTTVSQALAKFAADAT